MKVFWPTCAIALGVWETAALASKGKIPVITVTIRGCKKKWRRRTEAAVGLWLMGLGYHLLRESEIGKGNPIGDGTCLENS